jgi:hypothetical protein
VHPAAFVALRRLRQRLRGLERKILRQANAHGASRIASLPPSVIPSGAKRSRGTPWRNLKPRAVPAPR